MPSQTLDINPNGKMHKRIITAVEDRIKFSKEKYKARHAKWRQSEERALAYLPERDVDALRRAKRESGAPQYTTIVMPYSYGVLMASHTYWTTVFMSRSPVMQYAGRHGETEQATQAVEAIIDYQMQVGGALVPLYIWLLDVGKYGIGVVGDFWDKVESSITEIREEEETILGIIGTGRMKKIKSTRRVTSYEGNRLYNVRPYDWLPDPRVPAHRFQEGEFCGVYNELGWNTVLRREEQGYYTNIDRLKADPGQGLGAREAGSDQLELPNEGVSAIFDKKPGEVTKIYEVGIELVPRDWGLGKSSFPEKWMFTVTSDYKYVIGAQPLGAMHDKFPFQVLIYEVEGYSLVNRSQSEVLDPIQNTLDWLINTHFYNVRKTLNNQFVVDPSRIIMKDVLDPLPGGVFRAKPEAYGTDLTKAMFQLEVRDATQTHIRDLPLMRDVGDQAVGVNEQIMGQLAPKGGRRSATESRISSTFGVNRLKTAGEYFSAMGWSPLSQMMLQNTQQYMQEENKFRLVGDLALQAGPKFVEVNAELIAGNYDFVAVDGTLPIDRFAQANMWQQMLQTMARFPEVMAGYDIAKIFGWVAQLAGLKNINQFRIDLMSDEDAARGAESGNLVPMKTAGDPTRVPEPGQVPGMGTTG
jgi:hypothetical protein